MTKEWSIRGQIIEEVAPRSFDVDVDGKTLRRNRCQIRKLHSTTSFHLPQQQADTPIVNPEEHYESDNEQQQTETFEHHETDEESDSTTIPYADSDGDQGSRGGWGDSDGENEIHENEELPKTTRSGRRIKRNHPTDYDDL